MRCIIYILLLTSSSLCAQDSLKIYEVPKYKLNRLLDVYHYDYPSCRNTVDTLSIALDSAKYAIQKGSELIGLRTLERDLKSKEVEAYEKLTEVNIAIHKKKEKQQLTKGRKQGLTVGAIAVVLILLL